MYFAPPPPYHKCDVITREIIFRSGLEINLEGTIFNGALILPLNNGYFLWTHADRKSTWSRCNLFFVTKWIPFDFILINRGIGALWAWWSDVWVVLNYCLEIFMLHSCSSFHEILWSMCYYLGKSITLIHWNQRIVSLDLPKSYATESIFLS